MNNTTPFTVTRPPLHLPAVRGVIKRRMLLNFCCDPDVLARIVPPPFRPKLVHGRGMAGICLIRLGEIRPAFLPPLGGLTSENAAHRIAVEWDEDGGTHEGVFIPRRDTDSLLNRMVGGKIFPGVHHAARFRVWETGERFKLEMCSDDGAAFVRVMARRDTNLPSGSVFGSLPEATEFFQAGALGWSAGPRADEFDGLELHCDEWRMHSLTVEHLESSFFADGALFPPGAAEFDSAFLMQDISHSWLARGKLKVCDDFAP
jgi:hypothetical protein